MEGNRESELESVAMTIVAPTSLPDEDRTSLDISSSEPPSMTQSRGSRYLSAIQAEDANRLKESQETKMKARKAFYAANLVSDSSHHLLNISPASCSIERIL